MNVSPGPHPIPLHPGDAPAYLGWIGKHLDLAQETQDRSSQTHLENFGGFEPASPPRWLLHHLELTACTCQNLLECSFTCWELPPAAAEGLECPPLQGPGFGIVRVQECPLSLPVIPARSWWALCIQVLVGRCQQDQSPAGVPRCPCYPTDVLLLPGGLTNVTWPCPT